MMKTLKIITGTLVVLFIAFTACKKSIHGPAPKSEPEHTTVTVNDLLAYQMVWVLIAPDGKQELRILYFDKVGDEVNAVLDGITSRIIKVMKLDGNTFRLDLQDNGSVVYTFEFTKKGGEIILESSKFFNINNPKYEAVPAMLNKSAFIQVKNKVFKDPKTNEMISFNADTWRYSAYPNVGGNFYECGVGGWKGKINGLDHMGVYWDSGNGKIMAVQKLGYKDIAIFDVY